MEDQIRNEYMKLLNDTVYNKRVDLPQGDLEKYCYETFQPVDPVLKEVLARTQHLNMPPIHVGGMEGLTLEIIIRMARYNKVVEIGTLAGFSGINIARAIGPEGVLHTIDHNAEFSKTAEESFRKAGVSDNIVLHVGRALEVLETLCAEGPFDAVFIDADKESYPQYLDWAERNIRVGGALFADNTYCFGFVCRDDFDNPRMVREVAAIRSFNSRLAKGPNFRATLLPFHHGLTMAVRLE